VLECILSNAKNHSAKDRQIFTIWAKEQDINKVMTIKKVARKEVLSTYSVSQNFSLLENYDGNFLPVNKQDSQTQNKELKENAVFKNTVPVQKPHFHLEPYTNDTSDHVPFFPGLSTEDKIHCI